MRRGTLLSRARVSTPPGSGRSYRTPRESRAGQSARQSGGLAAPASPDLFHRGCGPSRKGAGRHKGWRGRSSFCDLPLSFEEILVVLADPALMQFADELFCGSPVDADIGALKIALQVAAGQLRFQDAVAFQVDLHGDVRIP